MFQRTLALTFLLGFVGTITAQTSKTPAQRRLDARVPIWLKVFNVTGVGIAYIENGRISWTGFYGVQFDGGPKANPSTLYSVASLTKPITAEIALRLASAGVLSLDEPIWPYWIDADIHDNPWNKLLTPRLCLSHQTGFTNWRYQTKNVLQFQKQPGTAFGYSGEGFDYLAHFLEKKTGSSLEQLAQERVFQPIGMNDTSYTPQSWWKDRQAKPVEAVGRKKWSAADLLRATVGDYARFAVSVMHNEGLTEEIAEERQQITRNLTSPEQESVLCEAAKRPDHCKVETGFGLGWHIVRINEETILDHTGADSDVKTFVFLVPRRGIGAVIFTSGSDVGHAIIDRILPVLYPDPVYAGTLWPSP